MISSKHLMVPLVFVAMTALHLEAAAPRVISVSTPNELQNALASPIDGDIIELADGTYSVSALTGSYDFFYIHDPWVHFTIRAVNPGAAILDGGNTYRIMEYRVDTPGAEGWVTFEGLVFQNGRTTTFDAAALISRGGRSTFVDCVFQNNRALPAATSGSAAGALAITSESQAMFFDCVIAGNTSDNHGGAMLVGQGSTVYIHQSVISNNTNSLAGQRNNGLGGAIHVFNGFEGTMTTLAITNTRFEDNQAGFVGGAIMAKGNFASSSQPVESPTIVVVANCTFDGNSALNHPTATPASPTEGGAIMAENNVSLFVFNSRFLGNSGGLGGAIAGFRSEIVVESSVFIDNTAFGRVETTSGGRGGAIKSHSNDKCSDDINFRTGSVTVTDSFFDGNVAESGGAIYTAGDTNRSFSTLPGCQMGPFESNRTPVILDRVTFSDCTVDDFIGTHAVGGAFNGIFVDLTLTDSLVLNSTAFGTDPTNPTSSSKGLGGGVSVRKGSALAITNTTFAGNSADHEGGGLHVTGSEITAFADNTFVGNIVSPNGNRTENTSRGAAIYLEPLTTSNLDMVGAVNDSVFTDNIGMPVFELDIVDGHSCNCMNLVTWDDNTFYNNTFGDLVYRNTVDGGTRTGSELNTLVIDHGGGTTIQKSLQGNNSDVVEPITTAALLATPEGVINTTAAGDPTGVTTSYLSWAFNGGCAELDQMTLSPSSDQAGFLPSAIGDHQLAVWSGGACSGAADASVDEEIIHRITPSANLVAHPVVITTGGSSTLLWSLTGGVPVAGMISNNAKEVISTASGAAMVAPPASTGYHLSIVTRQGGAAADATVYVDETPSAAISIFSDGFESGDTSEWTGTSG